MMHASNDLPGFSTIQIVLFYIQNLRFIELLMIFWPGSKLVQWENAVPASIRNNLHRENAWHPGPGGGGKPADGVPDVEQPGRSDHGKLSARLAKHRHDKAACSRRPISPPNREYSQHFAIFVVFTCT